MRILLTNDDGYSKEGIRAFDAAFSAAGHEVWVASPSSNRSAQSHSLCLDRPITFTRYGEKRYHCSGSPTDCILYSLKADLFGAMPDLVVSGINHGYNCSSDILYSGTCSAASEAVLQGVRALAVSAEKAADGSYGFDDVASFVATNLDRLYSLTSLRSFVNLNFPPHFEPVVDVCTLGQLWYGDVPEVVSHEGDVLTLSLTSGEVSRNGARDGSLTDIEACEMGHIALSVVLVNPAVDDQAHSRARELFS